MTNNEFLKSITLQGEEWRDVVGYEGLYMISSFGRCVSLGRVIMACNGDEKYVGQKLIAFTMVAGNYLSYRLWRDNKSKAISIHRLVATAFLPNPNNLPEVDHIDTNRTNNVVSNLRWCTISENRLNPITRIKNSLSKTGNPKLIGLNCKPVVRINRHNPKDVKFYESATSASKTDGYNLSHLTAVCRGERKLHRGYVWKWLSDYETPNQ